MTVARGTRAGTPVSSGPEEIASGTEFTLRDGDSAIFGTYAAEDATDPPRYGVEPAPARRYNPFYLEFHLWIDYLRDLFRRRRPTA